MTVRFHSNSVPSGNDLPQNSDRAITEADVLITAALADRPAREPDLAAENRALHTLAQQLTDDPQSMLKTLVRIARDLCRCDTAGVSLLETSADGSSVFRWVAIAGALESWEQTIAPSNFSPCGTTIHCRQPQLYARPELYFTYLHHPPFPIFEGLLFPISVNDRQLGTIWIISHNEQRQFDLEDQRLMTSLAEFTAAALQSIHQRQTAELALQREQAARLETEATRQALDESASRAVDILESITDAFISLDGEWRITYVNQAVVRINNLQREEIIGKTHWEMWPWSVGTIAEQTYRRVVADQVAAHFEIFYEPLKMWLEIHAYPAGTGLSLYFRDISDAYGELRLRKQTEETLQQMSGELERQLRKFDAIASSVPDFIYTFDLSGRFTYLNPALLHLFQKTLAEAVGKNFFDLDYPTDLASRLQNQIQQVIETRQPIKDETPYTSAFGIRAYEYIFVPLYGANGAVEAVAGVTRDITERKQADAALRQSEERYRTLFESIDEGFAAIEVLFDEHDTPHDYRFLEVNPAFENQTGLQQAAGKTARQLVPNLETQWVETYGKIALTGESVRFESGSEVMNRWFDVYACRTGQPEERKVALVFKDISDRKRIEAERKQTEAALRQSEEQSRNILESINDGCFALDGDWRFTYVNPQAELILDRTPSDLIGKIFWEEFTGVKGSEFEQMHHRVMYDRVAGSVTAFYPDHNRWYEVHSYPTANGIIIYFRNVTDRKRVEEELRQKNAILEVINESAPSPIFVKDREGRIIYANPATLEVLGKSAAEVIGYRDCDLYPSSELAATVMENDRRIMASGQTEVVEESPDGIRTFLGMKAPYRNEAGAVIGLIGLSYDISDRVQLERDREGILQREQAAREAAENANRIKDEFLAVLSHELRSPLNPILGWSRLLQNRKLDETKTALALATIERNAKLQAELIEDLLNVSRILQGKLSLNVSPVNLASTIRAAIETVRLAAEAKSITVEVRLDPNISSVLGDATRLQQVVWNLVSNAVKFTPAGGWVEVRLAQVGDRAHITVCDNGKGIPREFLPYVFDYFRQADSATTRQFGGLGLGLAIVRHLVELHGGTVEANSLGEALGATFTVRLPLMSIAPAENKQEQFSHSSLNLQGVKVLVVDDDRDSRELIVFLLEQSEAIVTSAASASEAFTALTQSQPDILVSDIGMPEMDGYTLMRQVRALPPKEGGQIPAIALTAYAGDLNEKGAIAAGFQRHIAKPIEPNELLEAIVTLLKSDRD